MSDGAAHVDELAELDLALSDDERCPEVARCRLEEGHNARGEEELCEPGKLDEDPHGHGERRCRWTIRCSLRAGHEGRHWTAGGQGDRLGNVAEGPS